MMRMLCSCIVSGVIAATPCVGDDSPPRADPVAYVHHQTPDWLTFDELRQLSAGPYVTGTTRRKYEALWTTPLVSNDATHRGVLPRRLTRDRLGRFVRVVTWNIEKSLQMDAAIAAFSSAEAYAALLDPHMAPPGSQRYQRAMRERALLAEADIIILQEIDVGVKRSGYRNAAADLAAALDMNYAYVPEYVEVDPVLLGTEVVEFEAGGEDTETTRYYVVDPQRYKGLFGSAVLSRYPIVHVEGFRLFTQGYDWYWREKDKPSFLERLRRLGAKTVLGEQHHREVRVGGRIYFRVDLAMPELPEQRVSVINVHLEIKCAPEIRAQQMAEILQYIRDIPHPVILAGDFNSAYQDLSPTSTPRLISRKLSSPSFMISRITEMLLPQALVVTTARTVSNLTKNYQNPTAAHIPIIAPNKVKEIFNVIERFRFADGGAFDFRGDRQRSANDHGELSNSNERDGWAYRATFRMNKSLANLVGKYRLDWIFVKPYITQPHRRDQSYHFAPHFGRTLNRISYYLEQPISDHDPNLVDLPLGEPYIRN